MTTAQLSTWNPVSLTLPDDDTTVWIATPDEDEPTQGGYLDCEHWRNVHGEVVRVTHWMELPKPPKS